MRTRFLVLFALMGAAAASPDARAQSPMLKVEVSPRSGAIDWLESRLIQLDGNGLRRGTRRLDAGFLGAGLAADLAEVPAALRLADSGRRYTIAGFVLSMVGIAALVTDLALILGRHTFAVQNNSVTGAYWGVLGAGAALGISGSLATLVGRQRIADAIDTFNREMFVRARRFELSLVPLPGGAGASVAARF
jgi:hypothetical protein